MRRSFGNQVIYLIAIFSCWVQYAFGQWRNHRWLTCEGKINSGWIGGRKTNPFVRVLMRHTYWERIWGTVVDVKIDRLIDEIIYQPIISYRYYDREYLTPPSCERLSIRKDAYYSFDKYPIGTVVMLLIPEGHPEEAHILADTLEVDIKGIILIGILVIPYVAFQAYRLFFS